MAASTIMSLRLDDATRRTIARLARTRRTSQSEVVREAVVALVKQAVTGDRPYQAWEPVIGIAKGGRRDLSERTGERFRELLTERKMGRA